MKTLLKIQMKNLLFRMRQNGSKKKASGAVVIGLLIFVLLCMEIIFFAMWSQLAVFCEMGLDWLYFAMAGLVALAFAVFGSVFMTQTQLYDAKDNELLLSMPIRPMQILLSRMLVLLVMTGAFTLAVLLPAFAIYGVLYGVTVMKVIGWVLSSVGLILLAQALCCALGWLLHQFLARVRNKAVASLVYMILFLVVYFYGYFNANTLLTQLAQNGEQIAAAIQGAAWPLYALGQACSGDALSLLAVVLLCAAVFAAVCRALAASFVKTVSGRGTGRERRVKAVRNEAQVRSPLRAVSRKELRKFLTSSVYLTNMGLGVILIAALPAAALIFRSRLLEMLAMMEPLRPVVPGFVVLALSFCISTACISAPSVSLEGKSLWVIRSLPVSGRTVLLGKLRMHCLLVIPISAVSALVLGLTVGCSAADTVLAAVLAALFGWFVGTVGLILNLLMPRFDWINEAGPCKQSAAVMLTIFGCYFVMLLFAGIFVLLYAAGLSATLSLAFCAAVLCAASCAMHALLTHWGARRFETL
ncbi:MAG: hypothetical protein ACI4GO_10525 [Hominenteromicrobium sp.]